MTNFINRKKELQQWHNFYTEKRPRLIILYGKRRVGKTALLLEFARRHKALYLVARQESAQDQLKKMSNEIALFFHDSVLALNPFQNYDALFQYLLQKDTPILFDEFPYLVQSTPALPSILQEHWDKYFSQKNTFMVLCGSSIMMMESLLGHSSPLYGRRTAQVLLEPLTFWDARLFFPTLTPEQQFMIYAIVGGTPSYLLEYNPKLSLEENIKQKIIQKSTFLAQDTLFVLQQELTEPHTYYSLITAIAQGCTTLGEIINKTGLEKSVVSKYLNVLQRLHLIERLVPITEKHPEKSRKGIYVLKDNYFRFWFRFVFEYIQYIEQDKQDLLYTDKIKPQLSAFVGKVYEDLALAWAKKHFSSFLIGRWWDKDIEIDILGINESKQEVIFGEVKWKNLTEKDAEIIISNLQTKTNHIPLSYKKASYLLIAKSFSNKGHLRQQGYLVYDLVDICSQE